MDGTLSMQHRLEEEVRGRRLGGLLRYFCRQRTLMQRAVQPITAHLISKPHSPPPPAHTQARRHELAAAAARDALGRAEAERQAAERAHAEAQSLGSRITSWFRSSPAATGTVTATSTATGEAAARDVVDPSGAKGTDKGALPTVGRCSC